MNAPIHHRRHQLRVPQQQPVRGFRHHDQHDELDKKTALEHLAREVAKLLGDTRLSRPNDPVPGSQYSEDWYVYVAAFGNMAAAAVVNQNVQIQADSSFVLEKLTFYATLQGGTAPFLDTQIPEVNLQFTDSGSGRILFNSPVPISATAGTGQLPFILPVPRTFKAKANLQFVATNFSAANQYNNVTLVLQGRKVFEETNR